MSLILDALRKSEAERRRGQLPALTLERPPAASRPSPARAWWLALPVGVALAAIAIWLIRPAGDDPQPETARPTTAAQTTDARPAEAVDDPVAPAPPPEAEPAPIAPPPAAATDIASATSPQPILELTDLTADERRALPPLKLSMHLWSEDPARRFVILDGHRLGEGDRAGDAVVERIEPTGVILAAGGRRIRLPLP